MAGELWRQIGQIGKESISGTAVPATRKVYASTIHLTRDRAVHLHKAAVGRRDNTVDAKLRGVVAGGTFDQAMSADEFVELCLACVQGGVTPTQIQGAVAPATPGAGTPSASGGVLQTGNYFYGYTIVPLNGLGAESMPAYESVATAVTGPTGSITTASITVPAGSIARLYLSTLGGATTTAKFTGVTLAATGTAVLTAVPATTQPLPPATQNSGAYTWVFKPSGTLDTQTWEYYDGAVAWQQRGVLIDELKMAGVIDADNQITATLFGRDQVQMLSGVTGSIADRTPDFFEGWEARVYIDNFGATPGTTVIPSTIVTYDVDIKANLQRKYFADNTPATGNIVTGEIDMSMDLLLEADAFAVAEYNFREASPAAPQKRIVRLELGNNIIVPGQNTLTKKVMFDMPGSWSAIDLSQENAMTKVWRFHFDSIYDPTNAYSLSVTAQNGRSAAY
jgi:hypothetical protein